MKDAVAVLDLVASRFQAAKGNDGNIGTGTWALLLLAVVSIGMAVFMAAWQKSKAIKLQMKMELAEHTANSTKLRTELAASEKDRVFLRKKRAKLEDKARVIKAKLSERRKSRDDLLQALQKVTSWDDVELS